MCRKETLRLEVTGGSRPRVQAGSRDVWMLEQEDACLIHASSHMEGWWGHGLRGSPAPCAGPTHKFYGCVCVADEG